MKDILQIVQLLVLAVVGYFVYSILSPLLNKKADPDNGKQHEEVPVSEKAKSAFKHSESELKQMAELLFGAMSDFGTDVQSILKVVDSVDDREFEYIYNQFGKRRYFLGTRSAMLGNEMSLTEWFKAELSPLTYLSIQKRFDSSQVKFA